MHPHKGDTSPLVSQSNRHTLTACGRRTFFPLTHYSRTVDTDIMRTSGPSARLDIGLKISINSRAASVWEAASRKRWLGKED